MEIPGVSSLQKSATGKPEASGLLQQQDFMKLMTVQLQNQDPFKPMDNGEFLGQLAQFSTVQGIEEMQQSLASLSESLYSTQLLNASSLIGKSALIATNSARLPAEGSVSGELYLDEPAAFAEVEVVSAAGEVVRTIKLGPQNAGPVAFEWDGKDNSGRRLAEGNWQIRAAYSDGNTVFAQPVYIKGHINSVSMPSGGGAAELNVEGMGAVRLADVKSLS